MLDPSRQSPRESRIAILPCWVSEVIYIEFLQLLAVRALIIEPGGGAKVLCARAEFQEVVDNIHDLNYELISINTAP
jgi:hypothetical protein